MRIHKHCAVILAVIAAVCSGFTASVCFGADAQKKRVEIKDGWFYVDGEKFFVKGMCYFEHHGIDGKLVDNSPEMLDNDFRLMKEAGFNTVKSYLTPEKIEMARKHGLMIVNLATWSCFTEDYRDPALLKMFNEQIETGVGFSKKYDNVLYYTMDNEPGVYQLYYLKAEKTMEDQWRAWNKRVKEVQPGAYTSVQMMPPTAFADVSMTDVVSLNLYPFNPATNSIGYGEYARWYKNKYAANKPFVISEYGWTDSLGEFGPRMMGLLDEQIKAGSAGSYLFIWQAWNKEKDRDSYWWGIIPNNGKAGDWKIEPRPLYYDYQKYFEAVVIEPKVRGVYAKKLPFEVYGSGKTGSITASVNGKTVKLSRKGRYWWVGGLELGADNYGDRTVSIEAKDKNGGLLVKKDVPVYLTDVKKTLSVKISRGNQVLVKGGTYEGVITVVDETGKKVPGVPLKIGMNHSAEDLWSSKPFRGVTGGTGEYVFKLRDIQAGYLNVIAGADTGRNDIETSADADMARVELEDIDNANAPQVILNEMEVPGMWKIDADKNAKISSSRVIYVAGRGIEVSYNFKDGRWVGISENIWRDLSGYKGIKFIFKDSGIKDRIEVKIEDKDGSTFMTFLEKRSVNGEWADAEIPVSSMHYAWGGDDKLDLSKAKISFALSREGDADNGPGKLAIGKLEAYR